MNSTVIEMLEKELSLKEFQLFKDGLNQIPLGDHDKRAKTTCHDPSSIKKITSAEYAGVHVYWEKDNTAIIPTKNNIVVMEKNNYSKEWWNNLGGVKINGFFAPYGFGYITIFPYKDGILKVLEKFGYVLKIYKEISYWFIVSKNFTNLRDDIHNVVTLSHDYDYVGDKETLLSIYESKKIWTETLGYPPMDKIKYIGKFKRLD